MKQSHPSWGRNEAKPGQEAAGGECCLPAGVQRHAGQHGSPRFRCFGVGNVLFASALLQGSGLSILLQGTGLPGVRGAAWSPALGFWGRGEQGAARGVRLPKNASGRNLSSPGAFPEPCGAESCRAEPLRLLRNAPRVQSGWKKHPFGHARGQPLGPGRARWLQRSPSGSWRPWQASLPLPPCKAWLCGGGISPPPAISQF